MKHADREARFNAIARIGCIVCRLHYGAWSECHVHHATGLKYRALGKKADDSATFGLCPTHHQWGNAEHPSIHGQPALFKSMYGTQEELLEAVNKLIEQ